MIQEVKQSAWEMWNRFEVESDEDTQSCSVVCGEEESEDIPEDPLESSASWVCPESHVMGGSAWPCVQ